MTKWKVGALILVATLIPALTAAVVMADLPPDLAAGADRHPGRRGLRACDRTDPADRLDRLDLLAHVAIGAAPDERTAHAVQMIADVNPDHRLPGDTATERAVNTLAERHASAEARLSLAAGGRTRRAASGA